MKLFVIPMVGRSVSIASLYAIALPVYSIDRPPICLKALLKSQQLLGLGAMQSDRGFTVPGQGQGLGSKKVPTRSKNA